MTSLAGGMLFVLMTFGWMLSGGNLYNNWGQGLTTMLSTPPWGPAASSWSPGVPRPSRGLEMFSMILRLGNYYTTHYDREEDFEVKYGDWVPGKHRIRVRGKRAALPYKPGPQKCLQIDQGGEGIHQLDDRPQQDPGGQAGAHIPENYDPAGLLLQVRQGGDECQGVGVGEFNQEQYQVPTQEPCAKDQHKALHSAAQKKGENYGGDARNVLRAEYTTIEEDEGGGDNTAKETRVQPQKGRVQGYMTGKGGYSPQGPVTRLDPLVTTHKPEVAQTNCVEDIKNYVEVKSTEENFHIQLHQAVTASTWFQ